MAPDYLHEWVTWLWGKKRNLGSTSRFTKVWKWAVNRQDQHKIRITLTKRKLHRQRQGHLWPASWGTQTNRSSCIEDERNGERQTEGGRERKRKKRKKIKQKHLLPKELKSRVPCTQSIKRWCLLQQVKLKIFTVCGALGALGKSYPLKGNNWLSPKRDADPA